MTRFTLLLPARRFGLGILLMLAGMVVATDLAGSEAQSEAGWATRIGGKNREWTHSLAVDGQGNSYAVGHFKGETTIGMGSGRGESIDLKSAGATDIFVTKIDPHGRPVWAHRFGGFSADEGRGIAVTAEGRLYVTGFFTGTIHLEGYGSLESAGSSDAFLLHLDEQGKPLWIRSFGGTHGDVGYKVAALPDGGAAVVGYFQQRAAARPERERETELKSVGGPDGFVLRFDSDSSLRWARRFGGKGEDQGRSVALGQDGHLAVAANFESTARFGESVLSSAGRADIAVWKLSLDGTARSAVRFGGSEQDSVEALAADDGLWLVGTFFGTTHFDQTPLTSAGAIDAFVARLSADGATQWAQQLGGATSDMLFGVAAMRQGGALAVGFTQVPSAEAEVPGQTEPLVVELSATGIERRLRGATSAAVIQPLAVALDPEGTPRILGIYKGDASFNLDGDQLPLPSGGKFDVFLAGLSSKPSE